MLIMPYRFGKKSNHNMKKLGFTLIELIVSVSVISMVTGIFLANYNSTNRRSDLTMTAQKMVADIRLAQNYALGLARYGLSGSLNVPEGGWGVHFDLQSYGNDRYIIFADDNFNRVFDLAEAEISYGAQLTSLPKDIVIESLSSGSKADITFLPPDPITTITGSASNFEQVDIVLKDLKTNTTKTVRINYLGLTEVLN